MYILLLPPCTLKRNEPLVSHEVASTHSTPHETELRPPPGRAPHLPPLPHNAMLSMTDTARANRHLMQRCFVANFAKRGEVGVRKVQQKQGRKLSFVGGGPLFCLCSFSLLCGSRCKSIDLVSLLLGELQEIMLHETAVAWMRQRLTKTRPKQAWTETIADYRSRLKTCAAYIKENYNVEGLCRDLPTHLQNNFVIQWGYPGGIRVGFLGHPRVSGLISGVSEFSRLILA